MAESADRVHASYVGRGLGTSVAHLLTDASFSVPGITHLEIHTDKANSASSAIPRGLGFRFLDETPDEPTAPAQLGMTAVGGWTDPKGSAAEGVDHMTPLLLLNLDTRSPPVRERFCRGRKPTPASGVWPPTRRRRRFPRGGVPCDDACERAALTAT
jgi:hypothetical protein